MELTTKLYQEIVSGIMIHASTYVKYGPIPLYYLSYCESMYTTQKNI